MRFDEFSIKQGITGILNVFRHLDMMDISDEDHAKLNQSVYLNIRKWLRAPTAGIFVSKINNGSKVEKGDLLGLVSDTYAKKTKQVKAPFDGYIICLNHQAVVNQGDALLHIGALGE
jgi:predicted deacylase